MAQVTQADTQRAWDLLREAGEADPYFVSEDEARAELIAAALAEEREKARAPFLAIADACDRAATTPGIANERATAYEITAIKIRRAVEETTE